MAAYATPAQMIVRYDSRRLGELVADDGTRVAAGSLPANTNILAALDDASSLINASLIRGGRYDIDDLVALTGTDAALLIRLTCDLAYGLLVQRRGYTESEMGSLAPGYKNAMNMLSLLADGQLLFNIDLNVAASKPVRAKLSTFLRLSSSADRLFGDRDILNPNGTVRP